MIVMMWEYGYILNLSKGISWGDFEMLESKNVKMKLVAHFFFIKNYIEKENWTHVFIY